jgi:hypothetical protein
MDLIIVDQVDAAMEVWFVYPNIMDAENWESIMTLPGYAERLAVAPISYIIEGLIGDQQDFADDLVVMAVQPDVMKNSRKV